MSLEQTIRRAAELRAALLRLQQNSWFRNNVEEVLRHAYGRASRVGTDGRQVNVPKGDIEAFGWIVLWAFAVNPVTGQWKNEPFRFVRSGDRSTSWAEFRRHLDLTEDQIRGALKRLKESRLIEILHDRDPKTLRFIATYIRLNLWSIRGAFDRARRCKRRSRITDPLTCLESKSNGTHMEPDLARHLLHFSNFRRVIENVLRYHLRREPVPDRDRDARRERCAQGLVRFVLGMCDLFGVSRLGDPMLDRFDENGRLLMTVENLQDRVGCTKHQYPRYRKLLSGLNLLTTETTRVKVQGRDVVALWVGWSFARLVQLIQSTPVVSLSSYPRQRVAVGPLEFDVSRVEEKCGDTLRLWRTRRETANGIIPERMTTNSIIPGECVLTNSATPSPSHPVCSPGALEEIKGPSGPFVFSGAPTDGVINLSAGAFEHVVVVEVPRDVALLARELQLHVNNGEGLNLAHLIRIWDLRKRQSLTPQALAAYRQQQDDGFDPENAWMATAPLDVFLCGWEKIKSAISFRRAEVNERDAHRLRWFDNLDAWLDEESVRPTALGSDLTGEQLILLIGRLRPGTVEWAGAKAKHHGTVSALIRTHPYVYTALRGRIAFDDFCDFTEQEQRSLAKKGIAEYQDLAFRVAMTSPENVDAEQQTQSGKLEVADWNLETVFAKAFAKGKMTLIAGCSCRGKTVLASQTAAHFWNQGERVVFIPAPVNMQASEIWLRIWSMLANIPHEQIADRYEELKEHFATFFRTDFNCLAIVDWEETRARLKDWLLSLVSQHRATVLIVDDVVVLASKFNLGGPYALEILSQLAAEHRLTVVTTLQLKAQYLGTKEAYPSMIQEFTPKPNTYGGFIGLSAIRDDNGSVARFQYFSIMSQHFAAVLVPVIADFDFQRFADRPRIE